MSEVTPLQRRYERLLIGYPKSYRAAHGAELVDTLMEAAPPGQRVPSWRETSGLIVGGLRARARHAAAGSTPWWLDGLHLGVFVALLVTFSGSVLARGTWTGLAVLILAVFATMRGRIWAALPMAVLASTLAVWPFLNDVRPGAMRQAYVLMPGNVWLKAAPYLVPVVGLALLAALTVRAGGRHRLRRRSWWWLVVPATAGVFAGLSPLFPVGQVWVATLAVGQFFALVFALIATALARDARWVVGVAVFELSDAIGFADDTWRQRSFSFAEWSVLAVLTAAVIVAVAGRRGRRVDA
jgi:hypothetical protein